LPSDPTRPRDAPDSRFVFSVTETMQILRCVLVVIACDFLSAHLADLLSAHRRCGDRFATGIATVGERRQGRQDAFHENRPLKSSSGKSSAG
jgi:hypothetical protein